MVYDKLVAAGRLDEISEPLKKEFGESKAPEKKDTKFKKKVKKDG